MYLPTVWWTDESIEKLQQGIDVTPIFNETVVPIYSSAIHDWFGKWGADFGWKKMESLTEIQQRVTDEGGIGIICAKRKTVGLSGHIVPIVPETEKKKAFRENGEVIYPLQSQAGKLNYNYFAAITSRKIELQLFRAQAKRLVEPPKIFFLRSLLSRIKIEAYTFPISIIYFPLTLSTRFNKNEKQPNQKTSLGHWVRKRNLPS
ncbi:MAG: hypothetical protein RI989_850, partial [Bacteroidota bacterium]